MFLEPRPLATDTTLASASAREMGVAEHFVDMFRRCVPPMGILAVGISSTLALTSVPLGVSGDIAVGASVSAAVAVVKSVVTVMQERHEKSNFDRPDVNMLLGELENRTRDVFAAKRGTAWIVSDPATAGPIVMSDREYMAYRREIAAQGRCMDEVVLKGGTLCVRRYEAGLLESGANGVPGTETFDIGSAERTSARWFSKGRRVTEPEVILDEAVTFT